MCDVAEDTRLHPSVDVTGRGGGSDRKTPQVFGDPCRHLHLRDRRLTPAQNVGGFREWRHQSAIDPPAVRIGAALLERADSTDHPLSVRRLARPVDLLIPEVDGVVTRTWLSSKASRISVSTRSASNGSGVPPGEARGFAKSRLPTCLNPHVSIARMREVEATSNAVGAQPSSGAQTVWFGTQDLHSGLDAIAADPDAGAGDERAEVLAAAE